MPKYIKYPFPHFFRGTFHWIEMQAHILDFFVCGEGANHKKVDVSHDRGSSGPDGVEGLLLDFTQL